MKMIRMLLATLLIAGMLCGPKFALAASNSGSASGSAANSTPAPANETPAPANETPAPANATPAPANATPAPANATPAPANATPAPANATPAPANSTAAPANSTAAPATAAPATTPAPSTTTAAPGTPAPTAAPVNGTLTLSGAYWAGLLANYSAATKESVRADIARILGILLYLIIIGQMRVGSLVVDFSITASSSTPNATTIQSRLSAGNYTSTAATYATGGGNDTVNVLSVTASSSASAAFGAACKVVIGVLVVLFGLLECF